MLYNLMWPDMLEENIPRLLVSFVVSLQLKKKREKGRKEGNLALTQHMTADLYAIYNFLKTTKKIPQKTYLKWKLSLWFHHIHKKSIKEGWIWRINYAYNYHFISWYCNPGRREKEKNKPLLVVYVQLAAFPYWNDTSFHHKTFA